MRTSESIEQSEERKAQAKEPLTSTEIRKYARGKHPNCHSPRGYTVHGSNRNAKIILPSGNRAKAAILQVASAESKTLAGQIARAVFENNRSSMRHSPLLPSRATPTPSNNSLTGRMARARSAVNLR